MNNNNYDFYCGIDISKETLDFSIIDLNKKKLFYSQVTNNSKGIKKLISLTKKHCLQLNKVLFCCENTGIYTLRLSNLLHDFKCNLWIENGYTIAKSQGLVRGKDDSIDSYRIATYALRHIDKHILWTPTDKSLEKIKQLFSSRERLQKAIILLEVPIEESKNIVDKKTYQMLKNSCKKGLISLKADLKKINEDLESLILKEENLKKNYELAKSVPCIGKVSAMYLLVCTENFEKISTYRQAACYAGIAPFNYTSGSSIRGKTRISKMGNKNLKRLLHIGTLSILKTKKGELYDYFEKKKKEGKHIMSILNCLRNKVLNRVFACVKSGKKYMVDYKKG